MQIKCLWINHLGKGNFPFTTNPIFLSGPEMNTVSHIGIIPDLSFSVNLQTLSTIHGFVFWCVYVCTCVFNLQGIFLCILLYDKLFSLNKGSQRSFHVSV